ncbi:MAG: hypothetical protein JW913_05280 [Chitinispirillaceae bacterium]|nr:hypothetical protein [Chitinispirillaceae bacterium]
MRATEYTVGEEGEKAMPAQLPPGVGYTYCVDLSADGVDDVHFNQPVYLYLENFLNFPVGGIVPVGWYDKNRVAWIPADNGKIVQVVSIENNLAMIDVDGSGQAADAQAMAELGMSDEERERVASLYGAGQSLWRVPIKHFSPYDLNLPYGAPPGADFPSQPEAENFENMENSCKEFGSIIEVQNQIAGEKVDITGTPFSLHYSI